MSTCMILAAHPDDEILGAGIWMHRHREWRILVVHLTDGSPRSEQAAGRSGFSSGAEYAATRRSESLRALKHLSIPEDRCIALGYPDQELHLHLKDAVHEVQQLVDTFRPDVILTHAYEGGHPDHDSASFIAQNVGDGLSFRLLEYPLYRSGPDGAERFGSSLREGIEPVEELRLTTQEQDLKRKMLDCFASQDEFLRRFPLDVETLREPRRYNFVQPPHPGTLLYEKWRIGSRTIWAGCAEEFLAKDIQSAR